MDKETGNRKTVSSKTNPLNIIDKLKKENKELRNERDFLRKTEKELRQKNDELISLEDNYAASLEEARAITNELLKQNKILADNENKFRTLNEIVPAAIFIIQEDKYIYTNTAFHEITGYSKDKLKSMSFGDVIHPDFKGIIKEYELTHQQGKQVPPRREFIILILLREIDGLIFQQHFLIMKVNLQ